MHFIQKASEKNVSAMVKILLMCIAITKSDFGAETGVTFHSYGPDRDSELKSKSEPMDFAN